MSEEDRRESRASDEFMEMRCRVLEEERRRFANMREALVDVLVTIERDHDEKFARKLKKRVVDARSEEELRLIMDGMLVLAGFAIRPQP